MWTTPGSACSGILEPGSNSDAKFRYDDSFHSRNETGHTKTSGFLAPIIVMLLLTVTINIFFLHINPSSGVLQETWNYFIFFVPLGFNEMKFTLFKVFAESQGSYFHLFSLTATGLQCFPKWRWHLEVQFNTNSLKHKAKYLLTKVWLHD